MKQDDYSGLSRSYSTAPVRAISDVALKLEDLHATLEVATRAIVSYQSIEMESAEKVLGMATHDLYVLACEFSVLKENLEDSAGGEA